MKVVKLVSSCDECPNRHYYSGGIYECTAAGARIPPRVSMPDWCPLADYPATAMNRLQSENADLRARLEAGRSLLNQEKEGQ